VLVLAPTRELAGQIAESFRAYGARTGLRVALMFGGVPKGRQARAMQSGVDVLVATPGRLLDHIQDGAVRLDGVEILVLDEADHMLDLGFAPPIRRIASMLPAARQSLFFSATMPKEIAGLAGQLLRNPVRVEVAPVATTAERVEQGVVFVETAGKRRLLSDMLRKTAGRTLVFTRTKHGADKVVRHLEADGMAAAAIHGNKSQSQRERALAAFRDGSVPVLVATDIAARGIDVDGVTHVVNFDLPNVPESYVHRIGRTARAGQAGIAISFCDPSERTHLRDIEKLIRNRLAVLKPEAVAA
jgi:ATP-dependent RNA helicase RhlE